MNALRNPNIPLWGPFALLSRPYLTARIALRDGACAKTISNEAGEIISIKYDDLTKKLHSLYEEAKTDPYVEKAVKKAALDHCTTMLKHPNKDDLSTFERNNANHQIALDTFAQAFDLQTKDHLDKHNYRQLAKVIKQVENTHLLRNYIPKSAYRNLLEATLRESMFSVFEVVKEDAPASTIPHDTPIIRVLNVGRDERHDLYILFNTHGRPDMPPVQCIMGEIRGTPEEFLAQWKKQRNGDKNYNLVRDMIKSCFEIETQLSTDEISPDAMAPHIALTALQTLPQPLEDEQTITTTPQDFISTSPDTQHPNKHNNSRDYKNRISKPFRHARQDTKDAHGKGHDWSAMPKKHPPKPTAPSKRELEKEAHVIDLINQKRPCEALSLLGKIKNEQRQEEILAALSKDYILRIFDPEKTNRVPSVIMFNKSTGDIICQSKHCQPMPISEFIEMHKDDKNLCAAINESIVIAIKDLRRGKTYVAAYMAYQLLQSKKVQNTNTPDSSPEPF